MNENDKKALLRDINATARMLDYFRKERDELSEKITQLKNIEEVNKVIESQLKLHTLINTLHKLIHDFINEAELEGYEVIWKGFKAVKIVEKEDKEDEQ